MIQLIASDLDGTLLRGGAQSLSAETLELIHRIVQNGIVFAAASGRQYSNERAMFAPIKDEISYIAENGSLCVHRGKVIARGIIEPDLVQQIVCEVKKEPHFELMLSREDACLIEPRDPAFVHHVRDVMKNTTKIVPDLCKAEGPILKIAVCSMSETPEAIRACQRRLEEKFGAQIHVAASEDRWIDFILPDANKGTALRALMQALDIPPENCAAFGDQQNDVDMLMSAGLSFAMSGGASATKACADYCIDSAQDVLKGILSAL